MFAPAAIDVTTGQGIIAYQQELSDDAQFALVEFVARDRSALHQILSAKASNIQVFERGRHTQAEIEAAFRQYKKNFDFMKFGVRIR